MKTNTAPASTVDSPFLDKSAALQMPEFAEGALAKRDGKDRNDCPYAIFNVPERLTSAEWRVLYENRFQAWVHGFDENRLDPEPKEISPCQ